MHPIFLATGPSFKKGFYASPFKTVDLYPLICDILNIQPSANNGSLSATEQIRFRPADDIHVTPDDTGKEDESSSSDGLTKIVSVFIGILIGIAGSVIYFHIKKRNSPLQITNNGKDYNTLTEISTMPSVE